nr:7B2 [Urechis unicinctus]
MHAAVVTVLVGVLCACSAQDSLESRLYEDMLMQDLYKRLALLEDTYYPDELASPQGYAPEDLVPPPQYAPDDLAPPQRYSPDAADKSAYSEGISLDSRGDGEAAIRDSEYIEHGPNGGNKGFIHMSGGAGEGKQHLTPEGTQENRQEVKSDEGLPYYCHPPNPCPKGYSPTNDECLDSSEFKDTAESQKSWIATMMKEGLCTCDQEHMFDCPKEMNEQDEMAEMEEQDRIDGIFSSLWADQDKINNSFMTQDKRFTVVAKKSPRIKRSIQEHVARMKKRMETDNKKNPYLSGPKLRTMAKKG